MSNRVTRVNELFLRELNLLLHTRFQAETVAITVTSVEISPDLRQAFIYYGVVGDAAAEIRARTFFARNLPTLRREMGQRVRLKYQPRFEFRLDHGPANGVRVQQVLEELGLPGEGDPALRQAPIPDGPARPTSETLPAGWAALPGSAAGLSATAPWAESTAAAADELDEDADDDFDAAEDELEEDADGDDEELDDLESDKKGEDDDDADDDESDLDEADEDEFDEVEEDELDEVEEDEVDEAPVTPTPKGQARGPRPSSPRPSRDDDSAEDLEPGDLPPGAPAPKAPRRR